MKEKIVEMIQEEKAKLTDKKEQLVREAQDINVDMTINDHEPADEIILMIQLAARVKKIKEMNGRK